MGLLNRYNEVEMNPNYNASTNWLYNPEGENFGDSVFNNTILSDYGKAPFKGTVSGGMEIANLPHYIEWLGRGGVNLGGGLLGYGKNEGNKESVFGDIVGSDPFIPKAFEVGDYLSLKPSDTSVNFLPDPSSLQQGFEWGAMSSVNPAKPIKTFTSPVKSFNQMSPYAKTSVLWGTGGATAGELVDEPMGKLGFDLGALVGNLVHDWKNFRRGKFKANQVSKMFDDAELDRLKMDDELLKLQQEVAMAQANGVQLMPEQIFKNYPNVAKLFRVLSYLDDGSLNKWKMEQGEGVIKRIEEIIGGGIKNLDSWKKSPIDSAKDFQKWFNARDKKALDDYRNFKFEGEGWIDAPLDKKLLDDIDMAIKGTDEYISSKVILDPNNLQQVALSDFISRIKKLKTSKNLDIFDNEFRQLVDDLKYISKNGYGDGKIPLTDWTKSTINRMLQEIEISAKSSNGTYKMAKESLKKDRENYLDPLERVGLLKAIQSGDPQAVLPAIDRLFKTENINNLDFTTAIRSLEDIGGHRMIEELITGHLQSRMTNVLTNKSTDLNKAIKISDDVSGLMVQNERWESVLLELFKAQGGKVDEFDDLSKASDGLNALMSWIKTTQYLNNPKGESLTAIAKKTIEESEDLGMMLSDITKPSRWSDKFRRAWGEKNIQLFIDSIKRNPDKSYELLIDLANAQNKSRSMLVKDKIIESLYYVPKKIIPQYGAMDYYNGLTQEQQLKISSQQNLQEFLTEFDGW
jgi:hypothetical protein